MSFHSDLLLNIKTIVFQTQCERTPMSVNLCSIMNLFKPWWPESITILFGSPGGPKFARKSVGQVPKSASAMSQQQNKSHGEAQIQRVEKQSHLLMEHCRLQGCDCKGAGQHLWLFHYVPSHWFLQRNTFPQVVHGEIFYNLLLMAQFICKMQIF